MTTFGYYLRRWFGRWVCRLRGTHAGPGVIVNPDRSLVVYCPRCLLIIRGSALSINSEPTS